MARDPETFAHQEWLGYVQPTGLVVSIPAMLAAQAQVNRNIAPDQQRFLAFLPRDKNDEILPEIRDFPGFTNKVLGWDANDLLGRDGGEPVPVNLDVPLPNYQEVLRPTYAVREFKPKDADNPWLMLIKSLPTGTPLDKDDEQAHWQASPHAKLERLLRETRIPLGLLVNGTHLRVVYAPRGETSGYLTFSVAEMISVAGRPIFAGLFMLLGADRLFTLAEKQRLPAILADSRKYQNVVSTKLAGQVLASLYELVRGFQAADDQRQGKLLRKVLADDPNQVYGGLLTVLMRLVFVLYAEDRGLLSSAPVYVNYYSVTGLFDRLRADAGRFPDTMNQRYGAWAQLLTLFRLVYEGGRHGTFQIPPRKGYLFDPDRYPFLEGRADRSQEKCEIPRVADSVFFEVLSNLLILDGERLSYRTLDVEQIGSVYETMMGFDLEVSTGRSIAIKPKKSHGAPSTINLEDLLASKSADRIKWLKGKTDQDLTGQAADALKKAATIDDLLSALDKKIAKEVTPNAVPPGAMILQPSDERRRSGSHYTPRILTEPIVRKTLEPILKRLGVTPTPAQILALKICDPAMGSAAFLVETCRQLGDVLVASWHAHKQLPSIPPDEDEILHARRLIAQRCLYGVDMNPLAVDLGKLSLWLATLARDHPFTFLDHALRHGDSLVGLTRKQIAEFHWLPTPQRSFGQDVIEERIKAATRVRQEIINFGDEVPFLLKQQKLALADESLNLVRFAGNLVFAAFFAGDSDNKRKAKREELLQQLSEFLRTGNMALRPSKVEQDLRSGDKAIHPFHWEIEFPEVFGRSNCGFDAIVGNPPFMWGNRISSVLGDSYRDWLLALHANSHGNSDIVAHFFRRAFSLLHTKGCFGLLATNSISETDTRRTGLEKLLRDGACIFHAVKDFRWVGAASVRVALVCVSKQDLPGLVELDGRPVVSIGADLRPGAISARPEPLMENDRRCFKGVDFGGTGFLLSKEDKANLLSAHPNESPFIWPVLNAEDVTSMVVIEPQRWIINLTGLTFEEAEDAPGCMTRIRELVLPHRRRQKRDANRKNWWLYNEARPGLYAAIANLPRVLANPVVSKYILFTFLEPRTVFTNVLNVFAWATFHPFSVLQSSVHTSWALHFCSTLESRTRYNPSDCFDTFPLPTNFETNVLLQTLGKEYYECRAALMVRNNEGLTKTYNRFHDPNEASAEIKKLRELHAAMDRAVLDAYGWTDLQPTCEFLLDYDEEEEDQEDTGKAKKKKKPWRYRWPDEFRDTVLARLLELNKQRADDEKLSGEAAEKKEKKAGKKTKKKGNGEPTQDHPRLF